MINNYLDRKFAGSANQVQLVMCKNPHFIFHGKHSKK